MKPPFYKTGPSTEKMMLYVLVAITVQAAVYALYYNNLPYLGSYFLYILFAFGLQAVYSLLADGIIKIPSLSSGVTTGLLILSIPAGMPPVSVIISLSLALLFCKFMVDKQALRLNPMLVARLFMMLNFPDAIQKWSKPGIDIDSVTTATPLILLKYEEISFPILQIFKGTITAPSDSFYAYIHGSPADSLPFISIIFGLILWKKGVLDLRCPLMFVTSFFITTFLLGGNPLYSTVIGSVVFAAVYIATDLRTTPKSKMGRIIAGAVAGVVNACIRKFTWWPEGIVFAFLTVNILSPSIDRFTFFVQSRRLENYKK